MSRTTPTSTTAWTVLLLASAAPAAAQSLPTADHAIPTADLARPLVDTSARPGEVWAVGSDWKARFDASGLTYIPRLGKLAPRNEELHFTLSRVTLDGEPLSVRAAVVASAGDSVTLNRGEVREVYHLGLDEIEQTFVFDALPRRGELAIEVAVESGWTAVHGEAELRFVHPTYGEVHYGRAFAYDGTGRMVELARTWTGSSIALTVPASFVAEAVLPLTVDPLLGVRLLNGYGTTDDDNLPDIVYDSASGAYWLTWEDFTSATDSDVFVSRLLANGAQATVIVDVSDEYWATPKVAASPTNSRVLVVASVSTDGPGTGIAGIVGRFVDTAAIASVGASFVIDQSVYDCTSPDVGGSWNASPSVADLCVVWQRNVSATSRDIQARIVNADGTFDGATISVSTAGANDDHSPAISPSRGNEVNPGDYWNVAWLRDLDHDGRGTPYVHRIYFDGTTGGAVEQEVFATNLALNVDVSSTLDRAVPGTTDRPFIVTFQRTTGSSEDIFAAVCTQDAVYPVSNVSLMEDFDASLETERPRIATDGTSFVLTFEEVSWTNPADRDVYALSGSVAHASNIARIALAERHVQVQVGAGVQRHAAVASQWDGGEASDDVMLAWEDRHLASQAQITLQAYDIATLESSPNQAIGRQYCAANAHADSGDGGRRSSFIHARGSGSVGTMHELRCAEMRTHAAAYFIVSTATGNTNFAGGGQGRLCLGGAIGRLVGGQILNTGASGFVSVAFDPGAIPTPMGAIAAAPGDTFHFQCWHRDALGGASTSNFSNACSITFVP